jgi:hypothetical protein
MLSLDAVGGQRGGRKVLQVEGDDDLGVGADRCCKDMAVVGVGKRQGFNQAFNSLNSIPGPQP